MSHPNLRQPGWTENDVHANINQIKVFTDDLKRMHYEVRGDHQMSEASKADVESALNALNRVWAELEIASKRRRLKIARSTVAYLTKELGE